MTNDEHWISEETLKAMMVLNGFSEATINSLRPDLIQAILGGIDYYGNLGADLGSAFDLIMRQIFEQIKQNG